MKTIKLDVEQSVTDSGVLVREEYLLNDKYHNEYGPAIREWDDSGQLRYEYYWLNGKLHNEHGPAYRRWNESGVLMREEYWINDEFLTKKEWEREVSSDPCLGKVITVDGKEYRLGEV